MSVSLSWLLEGIATLPDIDVEIEDLALDSRAVRDGSVFFALNGHQSHGLKFAGDAIARGARAILWEPVRSEDCVPPEVGAEVRSIAIPNLRALLGRIADRFFGAPSARLRITAITGTNGKTTCAYLLAQSLERASIATAYIGTIGWGRIGALSTLQHTTPDVISVHRMLAQLASAGVTDVAMEVSSHALDQGRVDAVRFHTAAFTNLTRDHLDYHGSMQAYGAAKARLFALPGLKHVVVNMDDAFGRELARSIQGATALTGVWFDQPPGTAAANDAAWMPPHVLRAAHVELSLRGMRLSLDGSFGQLTLATRLLGRFNADNALLVMGCLCSLGLSPDSAAAALACAVAPPGRMEVIASARPDQPLAVIDYAHTPDALAKVLGALREHCRGALWCVFGCGGDRDAGKRPMMGAVAAELADGVIVTDDNPRSEDPARIAADIVAGVQARADREPPRVIHDRAAAIAVAIGQAHGGDVVLIAGKGHEDYQIYGVTRRSFSDRSEALRLLGAAA